MSYQGHNEDKDKVLNALGGKRGLIDSGLPSLVFLVVFKVVNIFVTTFKAKVMKSVEAKIAEKIKKIPKGKLIFPEDFQELGTSEAVRLALHR